MTFIDIEWLSLYSDVETNECMDKNGGCWQDVSNNITACKVPIQNSVSTVDVFPILTYLWTQDTFRGRVCECPVVDGVQFKGDGYSSCIGKVVKFIILVLFFFFYQENLTICEETVTLFQVTIMHKYVHHFMK